MKWVRAWWAWWFPPPRVVAPWRYMVATVSRRGRRTRLVYFSTDWSLVGVRMPDGRVVLPRASHAARITGIVLGAPPQAVSRRTVTVTIPSWRRGQRSFQVKWNKRP